MIMREEFIDKTDRRKTPKFSYVFERIYDYILTRCASITNIK